MKNIHSYVTTVLNIYIFGELVMQYCFKPCISIIRYSTSRFINSKIMKRAELVRPFTVLVEGNIGSGKTTFLNHFSQSDDVLMLSEPVNLWRDVNGHNLLALMYKDPARWGLTFQTYVQLSMLNLHVRKSPHPIKLMERSIFSARYCFVENLAQSGMMCDAELAVLDEWFQWITSQLDVAADLIVYLRTTPEVVYERMRLRDRKEESCVPLEYLRKLHDLHEDWLYHRTRFTCPAPVLVLDANHSLSEMEDEFRKCEPRILQHELYKNDEGAVSSIIHSKTIT